MERVSEFETTAYILNPLIVLKMFGSIFVFHPPHEVFFIILIAAFLLTFVVQR
ncbi:hypothetical protein MKX57_20505 [Lysinibacillus sp. FSL M8-0216]|uniref:hypothetical protein n=1 Tax=Lysinibacillus TaxID=400634 RepID=UPI0000F38BBC|nr:MULTISPECIES: hypothetical protein [Lysinibacillus]EAZ87749.1 hypothetical protein BB14905_06173 [Bacillus sp. B14905]MED4075509.1 hypothetical protein [Lysinibacillus fusiformis]MED4671785.1 hypothetical protein [Lysinibacillus fusiformis]NOG30408.1 hypothetical protein [Lysinibacillus fusiformis]GED64557.1 hypothetical protein LFU01_30090 [Lysinibacillus fusiformis]